MVVKLVAKTLFFFMGRAKNCEGQSAGGGGSLAVTVGTSVAVALNVAMGFIDFGDTIRTH